MIQLANISPLPFYTAKDKAHHTFDNPYCTVCPLITFQNMLMPFQFQVDPKVEHIDKAILHNVNSGDEIDVLSALTQNGLELKPSGTYKSVRYPAKAPVISMGFEGSYFLEIWVSDQQPGQVPSVFERYYSEVFIASNNISNCLRITYRNSENIELTDGEIDFSAGFEFSFLIPSAPSMPKYNYDVDAVNRGGYEFVKSVTSKKTYKFTFLSRENIIDALRFIKLCDTITIISQGREYQPTAFFMNVDWQDNVIAEVQVEFDTDNVSSNFGGVLPINKGGDFNNDYNNDFDQN